MTRNNVPWFSIIVPTRGRPAGLCRLLDSFKTTTVSLDVLEVVLVIDADDTMTLEFEYDGISLQQVVVQPGLKMGELNMAGYAAAAGDYVMLLNDDVIVRTRGWDEKILAAFKTFADGIVLVHVNDKIFEEKLCTFPFLSRTYCDLAGGICPSDYVRYRIDDHIYNVFNLLSVMGRNRILYLPDVVFEHTNHVRTASGGVEYRPDERIHEIDTTRFHELLPERKQLALRLMAHIDEEGTRDKLRFRQNLLRPIVDSVALRRPEYVRESFDGKFLSSATTRVTIGIVSANLRSDHARTCIDLVKKFTSNFDLVILDNNGRSNFNHPHEMNKLLSTCDTEYLVLMDDDVFVETGWLDGMLRCVTPPVGVVTPLHKDRDGKLSYAGIVMRPDYSGHHTHSFAVPDGPTRIQTFCSAILLIDMGKCGHMRFDESYSKYFLDIDYGLQVWSAGYEVICSPYSIVTHIGGATLQQGSALSNDLFEFQRQHFVREWVETDRYRQLEQGAWQKISEIRALGDLASEVEALIKEPGKDRELFKDRALTLFRTIKNYPAVAHWASQRISDVLGSNQPTIDDPELGHLRFLLGCLPHAILIEQNFDDLNFILFDDEYYAIPQAEGAFDVDRFTRGEYSRSYKANTLEEVKRQILGDTSQMQPRVVLVEEGFEGLNIVLLGDIYYAIPQGEGAFDLGRVTKNEYSRSYRAHSIEELKAHVRDDASIKVWRILKNERARSGSWQSAVKSVVKKIGKRTTISVFGIDIFLRIKDFYLQVGAEKHRRGTWLPALRLGMTIVIGRVFSRSWIKSAALKKTWQQTPKDADGSIVSANTVRWNRATVCNTSPPAVKKSKITLSPDGLDQVSTYKLVKATLFESQLQPWRSIKKTAGEINPIPSMITPDESQFLYYLTRDHYQGAGAIIDLGPLAGGSTYALASGLAENPIATNRDGKIVSYDLWEFDDGWTDLFPGRRLRHGDDIQPIFLENLKRFRKQIESHKGDISNQKWTGGPIEILFIDAAKSPKVMAHLVNEFFPYLIPNGSYVIHQDYVSAATPWINVAVQCLNGYFEYMDSPDGGTVCVRTSKKISGGLLTEDFFEALPVSKARHLLADAREILMDWYKLCVWLGEANYLITRGLADEAAEILNQVRTHPKFHPAIQFDVNLVNQALAFMLQGIRTSRVKVRNDPDEEKPRIDISGKNRPVAAEIADPQRWLNASPVTLVEADYQGHSIYCFEYKYFAIRRAVGPFNYWDFKQAKYDPCLIGHSLGEVRTAIDLLLRSQPSRPYRGLVFTCLPPEQLKPLLDHLYSAEPITLLVGKGCKRGWEDHDVIMVDQGSLIDWARSQDSTASDPLSRRLSNEKFDRIIIPWSFPESWVDSSLEMAASRISKCIEVLHSSGERRLYQGENLHRLTYNKAYLASMFAVVPPPHGQTVLEAGCSDGLVCDIVALCGAGKVVGIDVMETTGCGFPHDRIDYRVMDIGRTNFSDQTFDLVYSIATFEHLPNPYQALLQMLRVTKVGGHVYVQAGPLYHSPFGHHMFEYFQDYPWIHLRRSKDGIIAYAKERGIDKAIEKNLGISCEQYVTGMLNMDHVNGLLLKDYRLDEFRERTDIEVLKFNVSYEGGKLLTARIAGEMRGLDSERLLEHGFEIVFRRIS